MMKIQRWLVVLGMAAGPATAMAGEAGGKLKKGFTHLFNGKDLTGWKVHGSGKWVVENGQIICGPGEDKKYSYLATERNYDDFELRVEFNIGSKGNSGVFFRSKLDGVNIRGWQAEVAPKGAPTGYVYGAGYGGWLNKPKEGDKGLTVQKPDGQWNSMRIRVVGGHVVVHLNGYKTSDLVDDKIAKGKGVIALQIHSGGNVKVRWRNIHIHEIKSK